MKDVCGIARSKGDHARGSFASLIIARQSVEAIPPAPQRKKACIVVDCGIDMLKCTRIIL